MDYRQLFEIIVYQRKKDINTEKLPMLWYDYIVECNRHHTYNMSTMLYHTAITASKSPSKLDINTVNDAQR